MTINFDYCYYFHFCQAGCRFEGMVEVMAGARIVERNFKSIGGCTRTPGHEIAPGGQSACGGRCA